MLKRISKTRWIMMAVAAVFLALLSMLDFSWGGIRYPIVILRSAVIFVGCAFLQRFSYTLRDMIISGACGLVFAIFLWIGIFTEYNLFYMVHGWEGILEILIYLGVRCIVIGGFILLLFKVLEKAGRKSSEKSKWTLKKAWMVITLFWLPHCLVYYPIRMGGGSTRQIAQFFGEATGAAKKYTSIVYEGHYLSNHHPVLTTVFYGSFFKLGNFLGNTNIVVFLLSLITLLISSFCMAYTLTIIKKYIANGVYIFLLVFVCIYPIYGIYSYTCCKDNLFASLLLVFISQLLEIMFTGGEILKHRSFIVGHIFVTILIPFLKNQGSILIVITSLLFLLVKNKEIRKVMLMDICCVIIIYTVLFTHIFMPILKIAPGGRQEALSLPFQQTAYYVTLYGEELNEKEYEAIGAVLPVDELWSLYEPNKADAVKFKFNQNASTKDLINYFRVWTSQFFKHPQAYISAFFRMTDRYYFWGAEEFDIHGLTDNFYGVYAPRWEWYRNLNRSYDTMINSLMSLPLIRIIVKIPFMTWTMMFTLFYCTYRRWRHCFLIMFPILLSFGICLLSPWNGVIRYALPITYSFPIMICILMKQEKISHVKEDKGFF